MHAPCTDIDIRPEAAATLLRSARAATRVASATARTRHGCARCKPAGRLIQSHDLATNSAPPPLASQRLRREEGATGICGPAPWPYARATRERARSRIRRPAAGRPPARVSSNAPPRRPTNHPKTTRPGLRDLYRRQGPTHVPRYEAAPWGPEPAYANFGRVSDNTSRALAIPTRDCAPRTSSHATRATRALSLEMYTPTGDTNHNVKRLHTTILLWRPVRPAACTTQGTTPNIGVLDVYVRSPLGRNHNLRRPLMRTRAPTSAKHLCRTHARAAKGMQNKRSCAIRCTSR